MNVFTPCPRIKKATAFSFLLIFLVSLCVSCKKAEESASKPETEEEPTENNYYKLILKKGQEVTGTKELKFSVVPHTNVASNFQGTSSEKSIQLYDAQYIVKTKFITRNANLWVTDPNDPNPKSAENGERTMYYFYSLLYTNDKVTVSHILFTKAVFVGVYEGSVGYLPMVTISFQR